MSRDRAGDDAAPERELGTVDATVPDAVFFDPITEAEIAAWEGVRTGPRPQGRSPRTAPARRCADEGPGSRRRLGSSAVSIRPATSTT